MEKGVVKWFNNAKGYGFILPEGSDQDVFVHYSSINMNGYRTLSTGQTVLFDAISGSKGLHATAIKLIDSDGQPLSDAHIAELQEANGNTLHDRADA
ncbi:Cold shock-like protein CspD [BD1-7 clade bacterium]|uniref:Cold shock-like protein CspD n=1 Tax=BD1-7 clade bacterium TaxID=2029982 RepID=A0A5S9QNC4_9GAMM|nr:Cold shock-like protein CspD [BD1-7 clade bacterium]CAA0119713.1 Cold shock-like protein CspD [BD1-7 clade bacterium]CAA0120903.1 Cold shock-like protein CspD [BD1-7 clade bacterium]